MNRNILNRDKKDERVLSSKKVHSIESMSGYKKFLSKLKQQESLMEKNLINLMENMKLEPDVLQLILHDMNDISKKRQISLDNTKKYLDEIVGELKLAKSVTKCTDKIQKLDTNVYKQQLVRLSQKLWDLKESCQLQSFSQEQKTLESDLREFALNLHKYENTTNNIGNPTSAASFERKNKRCHDYKEIQDFHALIAKTGHTDNWSNEDHLLFLKMRKKCNNIPALVAAVQVKCPDLDAETIVNHETWYKVYLNLHEKQRSAIREWRVKREMEKTIKNCENKTEAETLTAIPSEKTNSNTMDKLSVYLANKCERRTIKTRDINAVNAGSTNDKKELIKRWKVEKKNKRSINEEQMRILMESKRAAQEKRKKERLKRIREALAEYRAKKLIKVSSGMSKDDSKTERKYNPILIETFRKRDKEYGERKKRNLIKKLNSSNENHATKVGSDKLQVAKMHDRSTLLNPTKVWNERCKMQHRETKEPKKLQYIKDVPRLYVQWRNKESIEIKDALIFL